ncbi:M10 family metallopeptidase C-terminal domain-containing protein [Phenylobacterium sp.]|jgi:serralysin|uniref:M10 family metallopeptidase C-terminal domain-containing protein n=1 Tax=Phenylobacterium sp. TaxID=1871053 RepID=UPI002F94962D
MSAESLAPAFETGLAYTHLSADGGASGRCPCPVCRGQVLVVDAPADAGGGAQGFLNADQRNGPSPNDKPSYTVERAALQMTGYYQVETENGLELRPAPGWGGLAGQAYTVTYGFRASAPAQMPKDDDGEAGGFTRFNEQQIRQAELALQAWADVARITFVRVGSGTSGEGAYTDNASILMAGYTSGFKGASAFANFPGNPAVSDNDGDLWVNVSISTNAFPVTGSVGQQVLLHEIGHTIGLAHPGDYDASDDGPVTYAGSAEYYEDSRQYTVMSYFNEGNTGANFRGSYPAAPMLDDIAAAQVEYGANMTTRTGDTTYGFNSNAGRPWFEATSAASRMVFAVWDAGGNDTFDFSGYTASQVVDLREGFFSNVGTLVGNVAVAMGTVIENAITGIGSDTLNGNAVANRLLSGAGNDTLSGFAGQDLLRGEDGDDVIYGGADFDDIHGNKGNDTAYGGAGDDWVVGGQNDDLLFGEDGDDLALGNLGADTIDGGLGADVLRGGQQDDVVRGGAGADFISGDRGDDTLTGGAGADIFHIFDGAAVDRVTDFSVAEGDRVQLLPGATWGVQQEGADTVVLTGDGRLVLVGVQMSSLPPGWIIT